MKCSLHDIFLTTKKSSDKWALYLDVYEELFISFRDRPISILEIGVQNGGFTEALATYFPNAVRVVGCDIEEACGKLEFSDPRISVVVGDASQIETVNHIKTITNAFDIIIDDGSHKSKDIVTTFCHYFPLLRENGIFIAEDLHCSYWYEYEGGLVYPYSSISFFKLLIDIANFEHWGVPQTRVRLLSEILEHYKCSIDDEELQKIFSIEFINSMCLVRKKMAPAVLLNQRMVSSGDYLVADNKVYNLENTTPNDQRGNPYSDLDIVTNKHVFGIFFQLLNNNSNLLNQVNILDSNLSNQVSILDANLSNQVSILDANIGERFAGVNSNFEQLKRNKTFFSWLRDKLRSR